MAFSAEDLERTNARMRQLAHLSIMMAPDLQIAPQERQRARHNQQDHVASKPARDALPTVSPMAQRLMEQSRRKEIEQERDRLRDDIVRELQEKYLLNDKEFLYPERSRHFDLHQIQFPAKPFLPVEVFEDGQGLASFPRIVEEKHRCRRRVPEVAGRGITTEVSTVLHGADPRSRFAHTANGDTPWANSTGGAGQHQPPQHFSVSPSSVSTTMMRGGGAENSNSNGGVVAAGSVALQRESPLYSIARQAQLEQLETARKLQMWRRQKQDRQHVVPTSIFDQQFHDLRAGASSIETKRSIDKSRARALIPLTGINAADATGLGAVAPGRAGRQLVYERAPELRAERERNAQAYAQREQQMGESRTEYQKFANETRGVARAPVVPCRGRYFNPPAQSPRNREVLTHGADIVELAPRTLPDAAASGRRVQILSTAKTAVP